MDINYYSPKKKLTARSLTTMAGVVQSDIYEIILEAERLETMRRFKENIRFLDGQNVCLYTERPSGSTRLAFEIAVRSLGGNAIVIPIDEGDLTRELSIAAKMDVAAIFIEKEGFFGYDPKLPQGAPIFNVTGIDNPIFALSAILVLKRRFSTLKNLKTAVKDRSNFVLALSKCEIDLYYLTEEINGLAYNDEKYLSQFCPVTIVEYKDKPLSSVVKNPSAVILSDVVSECDAENFAQTVKDFALYSPLSSSGEPYEISGDISVAVYEIIRAIVSLVCG